MLTGKTGGHHYDCATSEAASSFPVLSGPSLCRRPDLVAAAHRHQPPFATSGPAGGNRGAGKCTLSGRSSKKGKFTAAMIFSLLLVTNSQRINYFVREKKCSAQFFIISTQTSARIYRPSFGLVFVKTRSINSGSYGGRMAKDGVKSQKQCTFIQFSLMVCT